MKLFKSVTNRISRIVNIGLAIGAACMASHDAHGQGRGLDVFKATRTYNLGVATIPGGSASTVTNAYQDIHGMDGISQIAIYANTNQTAGVGTNLSLTLSIYLSPDQTNWNVLTNYALVSSNTTFIVTNGNYGGNTNYTFAVTNGLLATNKLLYPFQWTVPNASTAGFATPYAALGSWAYTNGGPITLTAANQGFFMVGFDAGVLAAQGQAAGASPPRYVQLVWTYGAQNFWNVGAILTTYSRQNYP